MRATLDWSYDLLTPEQQQLFRLLAVFRGGAGLAAVERVASASGMAGDQVLPLLHELVEHSLVVVRPGHEGELRYDLLEPVAQYARTLLLGPESAVAATAHAAYFREVAEEAAVGYERDTQVSWLGRMELEEANVLLAIDRSLDSGDAATAGTITFAMWLYWWLRGQLVVGRRKAEQCLPVAPPELAAKVHLTAATMSYAAGDLEAAGRHWNASLELGGRLGDAEVLAKATAGVGLADLSAGRLDAAAARFEAALRHGTEAAEAGVWLRSLTHVWLGTLQLLQGRPHEAVAEVRRGLDLARARGDRLATYVGLYNLSQAEFALGQHDEARHHLAEGIALSRETRDDANLAYFLEALATVEAATGAHPRVPVLLGAAAALRDSVGANVYGYYQPDEAAVLVARRDARAELGEAGYDAAFEAGRRLGPEEAAALRVPSDAV